MDFHQKQTKSRNSEIRFRSNLFNHFTLRQLIGLRCLYKTTHKNPIPHIIYKEILLQIFIDLKMNNLKENFELFYKDLFALILVFSNTLERPVMIMKQKLAQHLDTSGKYKKNFY